MSSVAQPEFVKAQQKKAQKARAAAEKQYSKFYGKDEGEKKIQIIASLMKRNMEHE